MAKGKHSTALFEVIHSGNRPERVAQSLRTPKWWFKGRPVAPAATEAPEPPSFEEPTAETEPEPAPARTRPAPTRRRERSSAVHFEFDRDRQEITVRLRYTTALVSLFSVCVLVALAYVTGRHISRGPQAASAAEQHIAQLQQQPPQRGVTDISRPRRQTQQASIASESSKRVVDQQPIQQPKTHEAPAPELAGVETHLPRTIDLNYVIIQSYPRDRKQTAEQAREFFTKNGIPCTLVSLDSSKSDWICLVGTYGFKRISSPEYKEYRQKISETCANGNSAKFDQFKPYGYKWRGTEVPAE